MTDAGGRRTEGRKPEREARWAVEGGWREWLKFGKRKAESGKRKKLISDFGSRICDWVITNL